MSISTTIDTALAAVVGTLHPVWMEHGYNLMRPHEAIRSQAPREWNSARCAVHRLDGHWPRLKEAQDIVSLIRTEDELTYVWGELFSVQAGVSTLTPLTELPIAPLVKSSGS